MKRDYEKMKALIASAGGQFAGVVFTKKDGTLRTMNVQPAKLKFEVKGDAASDSAKQAVATRAARHPNLYNVWDVSKKAPRSINLDTVERITVRGETYLYDKAA